MAAIETTRPLWIWWIIPAAVLTSLFTAIMPVFYFALYRNESPLRVPKRLRLLALTAVLTFGVIVVVDLSGWITSLESYWKAMATVDWKSGATSILTIARDRRTFGQLSTVLGEVSNVAYILLLIAIFGQSSDQSDAGVPVAPFLRSTTKLTVIAWGIALVFVCLGLLLTLYSFLQIRSDSLRMGRIPPTFLELLKEPGGRVLVSACMFAAPYIIYRTLRQASASEPATSSPPAILC